MVLLSLESENGAVLTYRLAKNQIAVGSSSKNDVVVRTPGVADRLLVIHRNGDTFTFVTADRQTVVLNGERRSRGVLNPGDKLRLGGMTLVFRGTDGADDIPSAEAAASQVATPVVNQPKETSERISVRLDPAGFTDERVRLAELFSDPRYHSLKEVVTLLTEAIKGTEVAIIGVGHNGLGMPLASVWNGELPKIGDVYLAEIARPGRFLQLNGEQSAIVLPIFALDKQLVALLLARPGGVFGEQGTSLLAEVTRFLGAHWSQIGHEESGGGSWEIEAGQRLESQLPGTSQAIQVLRAGTLGAAYGSGPVLICGAQGVGRTEVGRILATLGPVAGRPVVVVDALQHDGDSLRHELFGPTGHPTLGHEARGALARARGGVIILRHVDSMPTSMQAEVAAYISAQQRESGATAPPRWIVTCDENPLALVQQGKLHSTLFMVFASRLIRVPRLTERREDLPLLIAVLLRRAAAEQHKVLRGVTLECLNIMLAQSFPGEMAELVEMINRLVTASPDGELVRCEALTTGPEPLVGVSKVENSAEIDEVIASNNLKDMIPKIECLVIDRVMRRVRGNQSEGARILGISRGALIAKLKEYDIPDYRFLRRRPGRG